MKSYGLACLLVLVACGKSESKDETSEIYSDEPVIWNAAAVQPGGPMKTFLSSDVKFALMEKTEDLMINPPEAEDSSDDENSIACLDAIINGRTFVADKTSLTYEINANTSACFKDYLVSEGLTVEYVETGLKWKFFISCPGGDLSSLNGKSPLETEDMGDNLCASGGQILHYQEISSAYKIAGQSTGTTVEAKTFEVFATGMADGSPCSQEKTGDTWKSGDGCLTVERRVSDTYLIDGEASEDSGFEDYYSIEDRGLTWSDDDTKRWYDSGTRNLQINNWKGTLTYTDNKTAPTYSLTNGSETLTGKVLSLGSLRKTSARILKLPTLP